MKVLVVEDEKKVSAFVSQALSQAGMTVDVAPDVDTMMILLKTSPYEVIILDRLLGKSDTLDYIANIRRLCGSAKILVLSALSDVDEKVRGLAEGADDYLGKPFHVAELVARVRALMRRGTSAVKNTVIEYEDVKIDLENHKVFRGDDEVVLTRKEFQILVLLSRRPGVIFTKSDILDRVWDINYDPESNVVEVTIANLRAKFDKGRKKLIHNRRGIGYWFGSA